MSILALAHLTSIDVRPDLSFFAIVTVWANGSTDQGFEIGPFSTIDSAKNINKAIREGVKVRAQQMGCVFGARDDVALLQQIDL